MKKIIKTLFIIILLIFTFYKLSYDLSENEDYKKYGKTVTFWTLQLSPFDDYINKVIADFEKENPTIKINRIDVPYSEGEKRTLASLLTDNPPDLINITPDFSLMLAKKNALYFIPDEQMTDFVPAVSDLLKYNDKYFGIPFYATSAITLYNKQLLKDFIFDKLPETYTDIIDYDGNALPNEYLTMFSFTEKDTLVKLLNKYDINTPETLVSDKSKQLFNNFKIIYDKKLIPLESVTQTHRDSLEKYMSSQILFLVTGANFLNMIKENAPEVYKNTGILPQLTGDTGKYDCSLMNLIIPVKSKNKKEALKFALFLTNKTNQLEFSKLTGVLPVNKYALDDDYFKEKNADYNNKSEYFSKISENDLPTKARKISAYQLNYLIKPFNYSSDKNAVNLLYSDCIQQILINDTNIDDSLSNLSEKMKKL